MDTGILQYVPREVRDLIGWQGSVLDEVLDKKFTEEEINWLLDLDQDVYVTFITYNYCNVVCYNLLLGTAETRNAKYGSPVISRVVDEDLPLVSRLCECSTVLHVLTRFTLYPCGYTSYTYTYTLLLTKEHNSSLVISSMYCAPRLFAQSCNSLSG